jgi:hypothetical protein
MLKKDLEQYNDISREYTKKELQLPELYRKKSTGIGPSVLQALDGNNQSARIIQKGRLEQQRYKDDKKDALALQKARELNSKSLMERQHGPDFLRNSKNVDLKQSMKTLRNGKHISKTSLRNFKDQYKTQRDMQAYISMDQLTRMPEYAVELPAMNLSSKHIHSKTGYDGETPHAIRTEASLPAPWSHNAERAFKDYYMRQDGGDVYQDKATADNGDPDYMLTTNIDRVRRKAKSVLKTIPTQYPHDSTAQATTHATLPQTTSKADRNKKDATEAQEAYQAAVVDEAGEYELNKTTMDALRDGAQKS